jgi:hypothetical protein
LRNDEISKIQKKINDLVENKESDNSLILEISQELDKLIEEIKEPLHDKDKK